VLRDWKKKQLFNRRRVQKDSIKEGVACSRGIIFDPEGRMKSTFS